MEAIILIIFGIMAIVLSLIEKDEPTRHPWIKENFRGETLEEQWFRELEEGNPIRRMQMLDALEHPDGDFLDNNYFDDL